MNLPALSILAAASAAALASSAHAAFTAGGIVVDQINGTTSAAQSVTLAEYATGTANQAAPSTTVNLPTAANGLNAALTDSGSGTSDGEITLSSNGNYIIVTGYNATPGTTSVTGTSASSTPRVIGTVAADGTINTTTALTDAYSANNLRSAASVDGSSFYTAGADAAAGSGIHYATSGASTSTAIASGTTNDRVVNLIGGNVYYSTGSGTTKGIFEIAGTPTTTATPSLIATDASGSPYGFALSPDGTTLYVADDSATTAGGGIQKYTITGGVATLDYTIGTGTGSTVGARGLIADFSGSSPVLYATTADATADRLLEITDGGSAASAAITTLATAPTGDIFRGLAFAPSASTSTPEPASLALMGLGALATLRRRRA